MQNEVALLCLLKEYRRKRTFKNFVNVTKLLNLIRDLVITKLRYDTLSRSIVELRNQQNWNQISQFFLQNDLNNFLRLLPVAISNAKMTSLTIYLDLLRQNVESNPGMPVKSETFSILTYNCNGLGERKKLRRIIHKIKPIVEKGGIVLLQETHIIDTTYLKSLWNNNLESNCIKSNSAGVITLFNKNLEIIESHKDKDGRELILVLKNDNNKLIISNSYLPNDHKLSIPVIESIYLKILELQHKFPDYLTVAAGDYNVCINDSDSMNRNKTKMEINLAESIISNNKITNLVDAYRSLHKVGGFTWNRGIIYSRLDYVFVSTSLIKNITKASYDWSFESSDHAAVRIDFSLDETPIKGPGIIKVNTRILENPKVVKQIEKEISSMMEQAQPDWNPHTKLEFLKVTIRSVFSSKVSEIRKYLNTEVLELEDEINQLEDLKLNIIGKNVNHQTTQNILNVEKAILGLKRNLLNKRNKFSEVQTFRSKAQWFEYGEKSNKFFLNLNKCKQNQKLISKIKDNDNIYKGQEEVSKGVRDFYKSLYSDVHPDIEIDSSTDNFYQYCPKLNDLDSKKLDNDLTLHELFEALKTCKDSSPGPDGIPYSVYKAFWNITGPIILESWIYSVEIKKLPRSNLESVITILPKEGKDTSDIKNWRPITLSNCDSKIITKALSNKVSKVLSSIIDSSQTAYVPGRSVADNLRSNFFIKKYCNQKNLESVLISLDAKKAFDSVNHRYIEKTLRAYGFGDRFIEVFKTLYKDITARILVNGFQTESIRIERGVKQGDALSCAIFIICIDPLLRNINNSDKIKGIMFKNKFIKEFCFKGGAYADDVSVICRNDTISVQEVFNEYNRLTARSGLELNAEKTEILILNNTQVKELNFIYRGYQHKISTVNKLKICGLYYCSSIEEEYDLNVNEKIKRLSYKIKQWIPRHLTMEGKTLIVKTFGLSQLIYNMQSYAFEKKDLDNAEKIIFKFLWSNNQNQNGIDRIKRTIMKNDYEQGGLRVTDVECLDRSLKLRQYIRAESSKHAISNIQKYVTEKGSSNIIRQEYVNIAMDEPICSSAQDTINKLTDFNRKSYEDQMTEEYENDKNLIEEVSSINLVSYLKRQGRTMSLCVLRPLTRNGILTLSDLIQAYEHERDEKINMAMKIIISSFPKTLINIAKCFNEEINSEINGLIYLQTSLNSRMLIETVSTKEIQSILKITLKKVESLNFETKLGLTEYDPNSVLVFRNYCKNSKLRNIFFRLIHRDFFTYVRMKKYKMTETDSCPRCVGTETINHLLWECPHAKKIWDLFNNFMSKWGKTEESVQSYENIYKVGLYPGPALIKIRVIQELIQIDRPKNWDIEKIESLVENLLRTEQYIANQNYTSEKFKSKWKFLEEWINCIDWTKN